VSLKPELFNVDNTGAAVLPFPEDDDGGTEVEVLFNSEDTEEWSAAAVAIDVEFSCNLQQPKHDTKIARANSILDKDISLYLEFLIMLAQYEWLRLKRKHGIRNDRFKLYDCLRYRPL